jgi:hypothetical protein
MKRNEQHLIENFRYGLHDSMDMINRLEDMIKLNKSKNKNSLRKPMG